MLTSYRIFHAMWSSVSVLAGGKGRQSSEYNLYFNVIPKTHWDRRVALRFSAYNMVYTHCMIVSVVVQRLSIWETLLQFSKFIDQQKSNIVQNGLGQQKKSRILHCTARLQNVALPVSNSNLKVLYKFYDRALTTYINIAKCKLGMVGMLCQYTIDVVPTI